MTKNIQYQSYWNYIKDCLKQDFGKIVPTYLLSNSMRIAVYIFLYLFTSIIYL